MPTKPATKRARQDARQGKRPATQAGEYVRAEMDRFKNGKSEIKSAKQAVAIGLSEARRAGVKLNPPKKGKNSAALRRKAQRDLAKGQGRATPSPARSRGAKKAAATRRRQASAGR